MQGTGVGAWLRLECVKGYCGACFDLGERSLNIELNGCRFVDIKIGNNIISEACLITLSRRELLDQNGGSEKFYLEEITVLHPNGQEHQLVGNGFYLRANYDAHNKGAKLEREYEFKRDLKKLSAEKEEIERRIAELTLRHRQP